MGKAQPHPPVRASFAGGPRAHRHPLAVAGVATDGSIDTAGIGPGNSPDQRTVLPLDAVRLKLRRQGAVGLVGLRRHQDAGGAPVQSMHDARPQDTSHTRQIPTMVKQRVDQSTSRVTRRRVNHQTRRLVHHDYVGVLVHHL